MNVLSKYLDTTRGGLDRIQPNLSHIPKVKLFTGYSRLFLFICLGVLFQAEGRVVSSLMIISNSAWAAPTLNEDELFGKIIEKATIAYKESRFNDAIKHFESAMMLRSNPNIHWNLSVCYHKLGRYKKALFHANEYLEKGSPDKKMRKKVEGRKQEFLRKIQDALLAPTSKPLPKTHSRQNPSQFDKQNISNNSRVSDRPSIPPMTSLQRNSSIGLQNSQFKNLMIWSVVASGFFGGSVGLHLYGDSLWESRPNGGGSEAQEAKRKALLMSWIGDGLLVLGLTSITVGLVTYFNHSNDMNQVAHNQRSCSACDPLNFSTHVQKDVANSTNQMAKLQYFSVPTFQVLSFQNQKKFHHLHGGIFGWLFKF